MCGRFNLKTNAYDIASILGFSTAITNEVRYNIAPSQQILAARLGEHGEPELVFLKWGLMPSWAKDLPSTKRPINARCETVFEQPYFRNAIKKRRCLIPANGFYEWRADGKLKKPFLFHAHEHALFFFAGIWERNISGDGEVIETVALITTHANEKTALIHDRMPVILSPLHYREWLNDKNDRRSLENLLVPYASDKLDVYAVSMLVNSPKNDDEACIFPLTESEM